MEGIEDNSFDGAYAIEAICHAEDLLKVYRQIFRVLKPGARYTDCSWCLTDEYDQQNPLHQTIKHKVLVRTLVVVSNGGTTCIDIYR